MAALLAAAHAPLAAQRTPAAKVAAEAAAEAAACAAANRQAYAELAQARDGELRRHAMDPVRVARLQAFAVRLTALRSTTARTPRHADECQKTAQALAEAAEQLDLIAGTTRQASDCTAAHQQTLAELQATLLGLQSDGRAATAALEAAAARLDLLREGLRENPAAADCRTRDADVERLRAEVQRLTPPPAAASAATPAAAPVQSAAICREAQGRAYNEVAQDFARVAGSVAVPVEWMAPLQALSERLKRLHALLADPAAPGWDCAAVARALAQARGELAVMSRR